MARIVKDADIRKEEIIKAAEQLFFSKGYENTSISEIIEAVGIAKGTFYHHFKSKEELLDAMLDQKVEQVSQILQQIVDNPDLPPPWKRSRNSLIPLLPGKPLTRNLS